MISMPLTRCSCQEFHVWRNWRAFDDLDAIDTVLTEGIRCLEKLQSIRWSRCHWHGFHARNSISRETAKDLMTMMPSAGFSRKECYAWRSSEAFDDLDVIDTAFMQEVWCLEKLRSSWWSLCHRHDFHVRNSMSGEIEEHFMISMPLTWFPCEEFDGWRNCEASDDLSAMDTIFMQGVWCLEKPQSIWSPWWDRHDFHAKNSTPIDTAKHLRVSMQSTWFSCEEFDVWKNCRAFDALDAIGTIFMQGIWCLEELRSIRRSWCHWYDFHVMNSMS